MATKKANSKMKSFSGKKILGANSFKKQVNKPVLPKKPAKSKEPIKPIKPVSKSSTLGDNKIDPAKLVSQSSNFDRNFKKELGNQITPAPKVNQNIVHLSRMQRKRMERFERRNSNVTHETFKDLASETGDVRYKDVIFVEGFDVSEHEYKPGYKFLFYSPKGDTNKKRCWIAGLHAGGGKPEDMQQWANDFTRLGYVYFSPEFRIKEVEADKFSPEEQQQAVADMTEFIYYIRKNAELFGIKKKKGFFHGISAGAIVSVLIGIFITIREKYPEMNQSKMEVMATASNSGAALPEFQALIPEAARIDTTTGKKQMPPNYFFNGELDKTVSFKEAVNTQQTESANGVPSLYQWFKNTGHKLGNHNFILEQIILFFFSFTSKVKP